MSTEVIRAGAVTPSDGEKYAASEGQPPPSRPSSKAILRKALALANDAVLCDTANNVKGAVEAYTEAVQLLDIVLEQMENETDKMKLREIHATYSERIRLLSKIEPVKGAPTQFKQKSTQDDEATAIRKAPPEIVMQSSTSTPAPTGKSHTNTKRRINQRSMSISDSAINRPSSVFNIPPPPPFQPPAQLKEANIKQPAQELQVPKLTTTARRKVSPTPPDDAPVKTADPSTSGSNKPTIISGIVHQNSDDPVKSLVDALSESPTEIESPVAPPGNNLRQHLSPPPRTHSIISTTLPRARKSSLLSANIYRNHSNASDEGETNATEAFTRLTGQRAPSDIMRMTGPDPTEKFDRSATIKALSLMRSLELSMTVGGHITQRLYVPKNLWYQPNIRLPSLDVKVSVCDSILSALTRLEAWHRLEDVKGALSHLSSLENCLENTQMSLSRKLGMPKITKIDSPSVEQEIYRKEPKDTARKHQSIIAWGNKLSKSVERMNAFNLAKSEDSPRHYVETLVRLFQSVHILDTWLRYYHSMLMDPHQPADKKPQLDALVQKLGKICYLLHTTVCSFVIRDLSIMLGKWVKRGGGWVGE
ncbi:hypothetical protein INT43_002286 [Umbelopsis isabellina]|uniref:MIT domain-containing protein n=1 Tax=Mortierella isabellina TaxID=91625 RepID=A0A8H7Q5W9_MORIS|nr:hypothetical protein INT43_002286 [Umbelopsis isabellina]